MMKEIDSFVNDNRSLYNTALMDLKDFPRNTGKVTASYQKTWSSKGFREGYSFRLNGKEYNSETVEEMKDLFSKFGYTIESAGFNYYTFKNNSIAEDYIEKCKSTEEYNQSIMEARKQIRENAKAFLFGNYSKTYVRFGAVPQSGKSYNFRDGFFEKGVSVYEAVHINKNYYIDVCGSIFTYSGLQKNKEAYEVAGNALNDRGSDGEPLLNNTEIIKKIKKEYVGTVDDFLYDVFEKQQSIQVKPEKSTNPSRTAAHKKQEEHPSVIGQIKELKAVQDNNSHTHQQPTNTKGINELC